MAFQLARSGKARLVDSSPPVGKSSRSIPGVSVLQLRRGTRGHVISPVLDVRRIQRKCSCEGNCPRCAHTNVQVSQPGDRYELEADRVAEEVIWRSEPVEKAGHGFVQRFTGRGVQRKYKSHESQPQFVENRREELRGSRAEVAEPVRDVLRSSGRPLSDPCHNRWRSTGGA